MLCSIFSVQSLHVHVSSLSGGKDFERPELGDDTGDEGDERDEESRALSENDQDQDQDGEGEGEGDGDKDADEGDEEADADAEVQSPQSNARDVLPGGDRTSRVLTPLSEFDFALVIRIRTAADLRAGAGGGARPYSHGLLLLHTPYCRLFSHDDVSV